MTSTNSELATAIAAALDAAQKAGVPLEIKAGVPLSAEPVTAPAPIRDLTEMDRALLLELKRRPSGTVLTLEEFAESLKRDQKQVLDAMRGSGRSALSVKDDLYERVTGKRKDGRSVRSYRLTPAGWAFVQTM